MEITIRAQASKFKKMINTNSMHAYIASQTHTRHIRELSKLN